MDEQQKYNKDAEVTGKLVLVALMEGTAAIKSIIARILARHNMGNPDPKHWYPLPEWLDVFDSIEKEIGPNTVFSIGKKMGEMAVIPDEIDSLEKMLETMNFAYHMNHKLYGDIMFNMAMHQKIDGIGDIKCNKISEKHFEMICDDPYPCEMDKGLLTGLIRRYKNEYGTFLRVEHDESKGCRKLGNTTCTYDISW